MKIEKKTVSRDSKWSSATKAGLAALIGLTSTTIVACTSGDIDAYDDEQQSCSSTDPESSSNDITIENIEHSETSSSQFASSSQEASSSSLQASTSQEVSSSSKKLSEQPDYFVPMSSSGVVIPYSWLSSSSYKQSSSSKQVVVDIPKSSSSFSEEVLSSIAEAVQSSSSEQDSSAVPESSSSEPASSSSDKLILQPNTSPSTWQPDTNSYIHLCPDGTGMCMQQSMVTTFEFTDVDV